MSKFNKKADLSDAMDAMTLTDDSNFEDDGEGIDWEWVEADYFSSVEDWGQEGIDWEWGPGYRPKSVLKQAKAKKKGVQLAPKKILKTGDSSDEASSEEEDGYGYDDEDDSDYVDEEEVQHAPRLKNFRKIATRKSTRKPPPAPRVPPPGELTTIQKAVLKSFGVVRNFKKIPIRGSGLCPVAKRNGIPVTVRKCGNWVILSSSQAEVYAEMHGEL